MLNKTEKHKTSLYISIDVRKYGNVWKRTERTLSN